MNRCSLTRAAVEGRLHEPQLDYANTDVICGNPSSGITLALIMMAYAPEVRVLCGCQTESGTTPLGATSPGHTGLRTWRQRARQRISGIQHLAQRKRRRGAACHTQTFAALVAGIPGNTFCNPYKECYPAAGSAKTAGARASNHVCRRLEPLRVTIPPPACLMMK